MTHYTVDYSKSPAPQFDAVRDVIEYLGVERYAKVAPEMATVKHCGEFAMFCKLAGISGLPVRAWYEHFHGQGSWKQEELEALS